jgi:hypothetical protein
MFTKSTTALAVTVCALTAAISTPSFAQCGVCAPPFPYVSNGLQYGADTNRHDLTVKRGAPADQRGTFEGIRKP